jgi:DNA-binding FadR family transcriptional regulator
MESTAEGNSGEEHDMDEPTPIAERRPRVRRSVTAAVGKDICSGRYAPGAALPRENDLCDLHSVSRTVIRESLKVLESKGLVRGKPRIGTTVCDKEEWNILDQDVLEWMGDAITDFDLLASITEARRTIEPAAAEYAAERATAQEIADLDSAWRQMQASGDDFEAFTKGDVAFHTILLKASHNPVFHRLSSAIHAALKYALHASNVAMPDHREAIDTHAELIEALRLRDGPRARQSMNRILDLAVRDLTAAGKVGGQTG